MPLCPMRLLCRRRWWLSLWALSYFIADLLLFVSRFCLHIVDTINAKCHVQFAGRDLQAPGTISVF
ncbi:unnamed protein product [Brassica napus]|uniref:(rape) hypothetical protein n=1 Tax=Brassica napus TaxID=3708 RepID=A0A816M916_BRANA|nr:unnamed protein product [Brassica napus]